MRIDFSRKFQKRFNRLPEKLQVKVQAVVDIFRENPFDFRLRNHALSGDMLGQRAFSVTGDVRVIFQEYGGYVDTSFGQSYKDNFTKYFEGAGGKVVLAEKKLPDATDFRAEMTKIKALNPDVLVIIHFGSSLGNALKQAGELGVRAQVIGDYESEDPTVIKFAGKAAEGMIISSSTPQPKTTAVTAFESAYQAKYGELPDVLAANAYDAGVLIAVSYAKCKGDSVCIAKDLEKVKGYDGVSGMITIDPADHSTKKTTVFKVVKNGQFVELK